MTQKNPNSLKNLRHISRMTPEQRKEHFSRAGKISAEKRAHRRDMRETIEFILEAEVPQQAAQRIGEALGLKSPQIRYLDAVVFRQIEKAMVKGDTKAAEFVLDRLYGKPTQFMNVEIKEDAEQFERIAASLANINASGEAGD